MNGSYHINKFQTEWSFNPFLYAWHTALITLDQILNYTHKKGNSSNKDAHNKFSPSEHTLVSLLKHMSTCDNSGHPSTLDSAKNKVTMVEFTLAYEDTVKL